MSISNTPKFSMDGTHVYHSIYKQTVDIDVLKLAVMPEKQSIEYLIALLEHLQLYKGKCNLDCIVVTLRRPQHTAQMSTYINVFLPRLEKAYKKLRITQQLNGEI